MLNHQLVVKLRDPWLAEDWRTEIIAQRHHILLPYEGLENIDILADSCIKITRFWVFQADAESCDKCLSVGINVEIWEMTVIRISLLSLEPRPAFVIEIGDSARFTITKWITTITFARFVKVLCVLDGGFAETAWFEAKIASDLRKGFGLVAQEISDYEVEVSTQIVVKQLVWTVVVGGLVKRRCVVHRVISSWSAPVRTDFETTDYLSVPKLFFDLL